MQKTIRSMVLDLVLSRCQKENPKIWAEYTTFCLNGLNQRLSNILTDPAIEQEKERLLVKAGYTADIIKLTNAIDFVINTYETETSKLKVN